MCHERSTSDWKIERTRYITFFVSEHGTDHEVKLRHLQFSDGYFLSCSANENVPLLQRSGVLHQSPETCWSIWKWLGPFVKFWILLVHNYWVWGEVFFNIYQHLTQFWTDNSHLRFEMFPQVYFLLFCVWTETVFLFILFSSIKIK